MSMKLTATDYTVVEEAEYPAQLIRVEEAEMQFGATVKMTFSLLDEDNKGTEVTALASKTMSPKSKLRGWIEGMLGRVLEKGEEVDLDAMIGTKCMIYVSVSDTDKGMFNRIDKIRLPRRKVGNGQATTQSAPQPVLVEKPAPAPVKQPLAEPFDVPF